MKQELWQRQSEESDSSSFSEEKFRIPDKNPVEKAVKKS